MANRSLVHVEIPAADRDAAAAFYRDVFGIQTTLDTQFDYLGFDLDGKSGGAFMPLSESVKANAVTVYFSTPDIDADLQHIEAHGGTVIVPRMDVGEMGAMAIFRDPTGNHIGLWQSFERDGANGA